MKNSAINELTDLVVADAPKAEAGHITKLLTEATRGIEQKTAASLIEEFHKSFAWIEMGFIVTDDGGPYLEEYRNTCLSILHDIAGGVH